jgi:class 3 adenylate cyclase
MLGCNDAGSPRKLRAILAADVVGYSRRMGRDESGTLARLREHRKARLEPVLTRVRRPAQAESVSRREGAPAITRAESIALPLPT